MENLWLSFHKQKPTKLSCAFWIKSEISVWSKFSIPGTIYVICWGLMEDVTPFCPWEKPAQKENVRVAFQPTKSDAFDWLKKQWVPTPSNLFNMPHLVVSTRTWSNTIQFFLPSGLWATANKTLSESFLNSSSNPFSSARFASLFSRSSPLLVNPILENN